MKLIVKTKKVEFNTESMCFIEEYDFGFVFPTCVHSFSNPYRICSACTQGLHMVNVETIYDSEYIKLCGDYRPMEII